MPKMPVVAAITNYNMARELERLLPQVARQGYDDIFVLDDASTDDSREVVKRFKNVKLVAGKTNKGAGGNRNRIIEALKYDALVHFLDADVELETENTAELVRQVTPDEPFGFVGGLIKTKSGKPHPWNYGGGAGLSSGLGSQVQLLTFSSKSKTAGFLRHNFKGILSTWPDPETKPKRREVFWSAEANLIFRSDIFARFGGFDENYRETEILDLGMRMHQQGLKCYFDPTISIRHTEAKVRLYNRDILKLKEMFIISRQLGFKNWLLHDGNAPNAATTK